MEGRVTRRRSRVRVPVRAAGVGLTSAIGLLTALRSIASITGGEPTSLLGVDTLPIADLGVTWSQTAIWPARLQAVGAMELVGTIGVLLLAATFVAALNTLIVLAEGAAHRRGEYAVRSALGEPPRALWISLLRELRTLLVASVALGMTAGLGLGLIARATWPHALEPFMSGPLSLWDLGIGVAMVLSVAVAAHFGATRGVMAQGRAVAALRAGDRVGADPSAIFLRNGLASFQVAAAGATAIAAVTLAGAATLAAPEEVSQAASEAMVMTSVEPTVLTTIGTSQLALAELSARLRAVPGIEAESIASVGALTGLGIRDIVVTQCGNCWRGLFPAPLWNALADHHAVGPDYFETTGVEVLDGRGFLPSDRSDSEPVAIVDISLARTAFENGEPIGRKLRVGSDHERWYTVVGVVDNAAISTLGTDGLRRETVYLNALQQPVDHPRVLLVGSDRAMGAAEQLMEAAGLEVLSSSTLSGHRASAATPIRWASRMALMLGLITAAFVGYGLWTTAVQTTRRRHREIALRRALGSTNSGVLRFILGERLRVTAWGLSGFALAGPAVVAAIHAASGAPVPGLGGYLTVAAVLTAGSALASVRALHEVVRVQPHALLDD